MSPRSIAQVSSRTITRSQSGRIDASRVRRHTMRSFYGRVLIRCLLRWSATRSLRGRKISSFFPLSFFFSRGTPAFNAVSTLLLDTERSRCSSERLFINSQKLWGVTLGNFINEILLLLRGSRRIDCAELQMLLHDGLEHCSICGGKGLFQIDISVVSTFSNNFPNRGQT